MPGFEAWPSALMPTSAKQALSGACIGSHFPDVVLRQVKGAGEGGQAGSTSIFTEIVFYSCSVIPSFIIIPFLFEV